MPTPVDPRAVDLAGFPSPVARTTTLFVIVGVLSAACHLRAYAQDYGTGRGGWSWLGAVRLRHVPSGPTRR